MTKMKEFQETASGMRKSERLSPRRLTSGKSGNLPGDTRSESLSVSVNNVLAENDQGLKKYADLSRTSEPDPSLTASGVYRLGPATVEVGVDILNIFPSIEDLRVPKLLRIESEDISTIKLKVNGFPITIIVFTEQRT